jgi:hypothetical protein
VAAVEAAADEARRNQPLVKPPALAEGVKGHRVADEARRQPQLPLPQHLRRT